MLAIIRLTAHKLRSRWRGWAALAVLTGLAGGVVLTAAAGAVRTDSAYPRFLRQSSAADVLVSPAGSGVGGFDAALARLPEAAVTAPVVGLQLQPVNAGGTVDNAAETLAPLDARMGHQVEIPKLLAGRLPGGDSPGEVAVNLIAAQDLHVSVGATVAMAAFRGQDQAHPRMLTERVVGVYVDRGSVVAVNELDRVPVIWASIALYRELGPRYEAFDGAYVKLAPGASTSEYSAAAQTLSKRFPRTGGQVFVADESVQAATIERAIAPQAVALALFALALVLCALLIVGQLAVRLLTAAARDNATLAALGMTRGQLIAASLAEVAAAAVTGAVIAVIVAVAASPLMPIGPARLAEPDPGVSVNVPVLAAGFAAITALLLARVLITARGEAGDGAAAAGRRLRARRRSRLAERLAMAGAPVTAVTGVRFALDPERAGYGRTSVAARSAMLGLAVAVASVAGAATFGANLLRLVDTPRLYGQNWDAAIDLQFGTMTAGQFAALTRPVPGITSWTFGVHGTVELHTAVELHGSAITARSAGAATVIPAIGLASGGGPMTSPTILDGRAPVSAGEIVLGTSVLRRAGLAVGQTVSVSAGGPAHPMRIVGSAVFPYFGQGSFTPTDAGEGAETTAGVLAARARAASGPGYNFVLVRFAPGPRESADIAAFAAATSAYCAKVEQSTCVIADQRPNTVSNYAAIDATPQVLGGVLAVLGLGLLAQFVVASARRRRRDFAVLKVLGLARAQLRAVAFWQVSTVTVVAVAAGVPLGIAGGRWAWQLFAGQAGLPGTAVTPLPLLWMIPATLVLASLVALPTARGMARLGAAATLRSG
jgi:ABC-type antimicrobial peptide transport system permease subunit